MKGVQTEEASCGGMSITNFVTGAERSCKKMPSTMRFVPKMLGVAKQESSTSLTMHSVAAIVDLHKYSPLNRRSLKILSPSRHHLQDMGRSVGSRQFYVVSEPKENGVVHCLFVLSVVY